MAKQRNENGDGLRLEMVPLSQVVLWDENPKKHSIGDLVTAIWRFGWQDPPKYDSSLGALVYGNGRSVALMMGKREGRNPPAGIGRDPETDDWLVPIVFGNDLPSREVAEAFAVDHNNLTMAGGEFTVRDVARMWDEVKYAELLKRLANDSEEYPVTMEPEALDDLLAALAAEALVPDFQPVGADEQPRLDQKNPVTCPSCGVEFEPA